MLCALFETHVSQQVEYHELIAVMPSFADQAHLYSLSAYLSICKAIETIELSASLELA